MATSALTDIINALPAQFLDFSRVWNRSAVFVSQLSIKPGRGGKCAFDVNVGGASANSYAEGADVSSGELLNDTIVPATLDWGHYRTGFAMTDTQIDAAASALGSPSEVMGIFGERLFDSVAALLSKINQDCISGDGTDGSSNPTCVGILGGALPVAGETYANIAVNTYTGWGSNVLHNAGVARPLTVDLLNAGDKAQFTASGQRASALITDPGVYQKYAGMFESLRRVNGAGSQSSYGTGASSLEFMGSPLVRDKDFTAGHLVMADMSQLELRYLPYTSDSSRSAVSAQLMVGFGSDGQNQVSTGLPVRVYALPKAGDSTKFVVEARVQLVNKRPNAHAWIKDIATV